jgi:DNA-binding response OmpR family regulator
VLVCSAGGGAAFAGRLAASGYEVQSVGADSAAREIENFAPQVVVLEARGAAGDDLSGLARRLRGDHSAARLPLVVVFGDARGRSNDDAAEAARALARAVGADDCFALSTPAPEALARLDALFWRVESGRDLAAARAADGRRAEIEDFMRLLEDARAGVAAGASGALALVAPVAREAAADGRGGGGADALRSAHEFLGRNLRRADSVAFYGPDLLVACLPRHTSAAAREDLARLHAEFSAAHPDARVAVGVAQFPEDGTEVERLIELAEVSLEEARRDAGPETAAGDGPSLPRATPLPGGDVQEDVRGGGTGALEIGRTVIVGEAAPAALEGGPDAAEGAGRAKGGAADFGGVAGHVSAKSDGGREKVEGGAAGLGERPTAVDQSGALARGAGTDGDGTRGVAGSVEDGGAGVGSAAGRESPPAPARGAALPKRGQRALRESSRGESFETSILPAQGAAEAGGVLARGAAEAAARERERRTRGARMPRRVLLAVSDPARMAQANLLLRSAGYEVRAAFDGGQALDLLRIDRADALVLDLDLKRFDGVEVLRRLDERHRGRLPLPVLLLHPRSEEGARACAAARTLGARGFVALPYDPAELLEAVRETGAGD